ncbi:MAG: LamG-like jellyroll fold domain-containing protein [Parcubacteria group bacterium]|jgi:hypothetical protein
MKITIFAHIDIRLSVLIALFFMVLFLSFPNSSLATSSTDTMEGYWKFDGNASDLSGDGNTGTLYNGATYSTTIPTTTFPNSQSVHFPYTDSYVEVSNQAGVSPTGPLAFSMWIKMNSIPASPTVIGGNYYDSIASQGFYFSIDNSNVAFYVGGTSASFPVSHINPNTWYHLTGTWDNANIKIYLNGTEMGSASFVSTISYGGASFRIGNFLGSIDDVRLYSRALSSSEIIDLSLGKHTSLNWNGNYDTDYEYMGNWSLPIIPDPYTLLTIPNVSNKPLFSQSEAVAGINILTGSSLNINSSNLTINDSGVFNNDGNFILQNTSTQVLNGFTNDINSGTVIIEGSSSATLKAGSQYYNLTINGTGTISSLPAALVVKGDFVCNSGFFVLTGSATIYGNIILNGGNLSPSTNSITLYKDWSSISGSSFAAGTGTVYLVGTNQSIVGPNTFYNLAKTSSSANTLTFDSISTQTIQNTLSLHGSVNNLLSLRSPADGTRWRINPLGTVSVSYLDIMDSDNINVTPVDATSGNIINSGNNINWTFDVTAPNIVLDLVSPITSNPFYPITGTATDTNLISGVHFSTDGSVWWTCTANDGNFDEVSEAFTCTPLSSLNDGAYTIYVKSSDIIGNVTASLNYTVANFTVDTASLSISSISSVPGIDNVTISWSTNENASSIVEYGTTSTYGESTGEQDLSPRVQNHNILISNLISCTDYHFRVVSNDAILNQGISSDQIFTTSGCPVSPDTTTVTTSSDSSDSLTCDDDKPGKPEILSAKAENSSSIILKIDEASGTVRNYKLEYGTSSESFEWSVDDIAEDDIESFTVGELSPKTTYYFRVRAENKCENGNWSFEASAKTDAVISPTIQSPPALAPSEIEPITAIASPENIVTNEIPISSSDTTQGQLENSANFEGAKESVASIDKDYGTSSVEMIEDESGKKKVKIAGYGPPNTKLTVYIYSDDPIVLTVKTDSEGNWSYVLDNNLEDGEHQIYVALTDATGKIETKSEPLAFVKTAQAVSKIDSTKQSVSPTQKAKSSFPILFVVISAITMLLALAIIGWRFKSQKLEEKVSNV